MFKRCSNTLANIWGCLGRLKPEDIFCDNQVIRFFPCLLHSKQVVYEKQQKQFLDCDMKTVF